MNYACPSEPHPPMPSNCESSRDVDKQRLELLKRKTMSWLSTSFLMETSKNIEKANAKITACYRDKFKNELLRYFDGYRYNLDT